MNNELDSMLSCIQQKDTSELCREVLSISDTMDVLRAKWNVKILTAILCGQTRFQDYTKLYPQLVQVLHNVQGRALPHAAHCKNTM